MANEKNNNSNNNLDSLDVRYKEETIHRWGDILFTLTPPSPTEEESRLLLLKVIEQAIRDFVNLSNSSSPMDQISFQTAEGLLFDDEYRVNYGGGEMSLEDMLDILGLDIDWLRRKIHGLQKSKTKPSKEEN